MSEYLYQIENNLGRAYLVITICWAASLAIGSPILLGINQRESVENNQVNNFTRIKVIMKGKLFQRCAHLLYCSVLSLVGKVNARRMSQPDMGSIFHIKNQWNILVIGNYYQNLMLLISSDTKRTLMHLFLFTNSAQRELVSICMQSIRDCN